MITGINGFMGACSRRKLLPQRVTETSVGDDFELLADGPISSGWDILIPISSQDFERYSDGPVTLNTTYTNVSSYGQGFESISDGEVTETPPLTKHSGNTIENTSVSIIYDYNIKVVANNFESLADGIITSVPKDYLSKVAAQPDSILNS